MLLTFGCRSWAVVCGEEASGAVSVSVVGSVAVITGGIESIGEPDRVRDGYLSCIMSIVPIVTGSELFMLVCAVLVGSVHRRC